MQAIDAYIFLRKFWFLFILKRIYLKFLWFPVKQINWKHT